MKRVFLIVLDSLGAGESPDAAAFGDVGAHTLKSIFGTGRLHIPNLRRLGIGHIEGLSFLGANTEPIGSVARLRELSMGKDTTVGHWEIAGHCSDAPLPTFPDGFPEDLISEFERLSGRHVLCNRPYSGTEVIRDFGEEHLRTGNLIVYTSADSVFQIAAHESVLSREELYGLCRKARELLVGEKYGVGRVIARPFGGEAPNFYRTDGRRDFSLIPPAGLLPEAVKAAGLASISVGKIYDIFGGVGFTEHTLTHSNEEGMEKTKWWMKTDFCGLCFTNLVDFDMKWGHRRDAMGYADGLSAFDAWLGEVLDLLGEEDLLLITADHGCDPCFLSTTDHTREYTPLLLYRKGMSPRNFGTLDGFDTVAATVAEALGIPLTLPTGRKPLSIFF